MSPHLPRFLIVEDERPLALALAATVRHAGGFAEMAPTAAQARRLLDRGTCFAAMILDIGLPDQNGLAFLQSLQADRRPPVLVITAHGEIDNAITARKLGVREFFPKPLNFEAFNRALEQLVEAFSDGHPRHLEIRPEGVSEFPGENAFIGAAPSMREVFQQIAHACASREPVLIRGETGTGKTHVAHLIRRHSQGAGDPLAVHLGGGDPGKDTGSSLAGALDDAAGGTLILEEIGALTPEDQRTLVHGIEEGSESFPRILATCTEALRDKVDSGAFRSDLFYRLQVLEVRLPPLRDRREDLPVLAAYFSGLLAPDRRVHTTEEGLKQLASHSWPGNLRELRNVVSYAITATAGGTRIEATHLPGYLGNPPATLSENPPDTGELPPDLLDALGHWLDLRLASAPPPTYRELADALEVALLQDLLPRFDGKLARLAKELQANRGTLRKKLKDE